MAKYGEHVESGIDSGHPIVCIEDYEVFDYIDDYLTEDCDLEYDYMTEPSDNQHVMHFAPEVSIASVEDALSRLSIEELHRIYLLNNRA